MSFAASEWPQMTCGVCPAENLEDFSNDRAIFCVSPLNRKSIPMVALSKSRPYEPAYPWPANTVASIVEPFVRSTRLTEIIGLDGR